jgi:hypothetical protein
MLPISMIAAPLSMRYGQKLVGGSGLAISALGVAFFSTLGVHSGFGPLVVAEVLLAVGIGLAMTPATNAIVSSLPAAKQGVASAVNDTARELGAAFGVAVLGSAFNTGYRSAINGHLGGLSASLADQAREAPAIALRLAAGAPGGSALAAAARDAFTTGMRASVGVGAVLLLSGAAFVWLRGSSGAGPTLDLDEAGVGDETEAKGLGTLALDGIT